MARRSAGFGERSITFVSDSLLFSGDEPDVPTSFYFDDYPLDVAVLDGDEISVLFGSYSVARYKYTVTPIKLTLLEHVRSERFALIMSCVLIGSSWSDLVVVAGTTDGEILVTVPSSGPLIRAKFEGHRGMIFGLDLDNNKLYSVADDRCLCVWDAGILRRLSKGTAPVDVVTKLDGQFGHSARPYSICHDSSGNIYTAGDDEVVCVWKMENGKLKMRYQRDIMTGSIRALRVLNENLYIACGSGGLATISIEELSDDAELRRDPSHNNRAFARMTNKIVCLEENSSEKADIRSFARSPMYATTPLILAGIGDKFCHFIIEECVVWPSCLFSFHILSVAICENFAFVYTSDRTGTLLDVPDRRIAATFDFSETLDLIGITSRMKITSTSVISADDALFVIAGTLSGHVFYASCAAGSLSATVDSSRALNAHLEAKPVNQIRSKNGDIFILGSNGVVVLCRRDGNSSLDVVSARPACPLLRGFTPCSFSPKNDYIYGFHAKNFYVVDARNGDTLCTLSCGGIHRQWYFTLYPNYDVLRKDEARVCRATFDFLRKGSVFSIDLYLKRVTILVPYIHRSQVVGVSLLDEAQGVTRVVTVGADFFVQVSEITWRKSKWRVVLSLFNPMAPTCSRSTPFSRDNGFLVVVGGEKGTVMSWMISESVLEERNSYAVRSSLYRRAESSARAMDLDVVQTSNSLYRSAVAYADGKIEWLLLGLSDRGSIRVERDGRYEAIKSPDYSIFTKVTLWTVNDDVYLCAASTSGYVFLWKASKSTELLCKVFVDRCGLSALACLYGNELQWIAVGSESGAVTVFSVENDRLEKLATLTYHSATITGVSLCMGEAVLLVSSVGLDCRFAIHSINTSTGQVCFLHAVPVGVRDPAALLVTSSGAVTVGNGLELVPNAV